MPNSHNSPFRHVPVLCSGDDNPVAPLHSTSHKSQASGRPSEIGDSVGHPSVNRSSGCKPPAASSKSQSPNPKLHQFEIQHSSFPEKSGLRTAHSITQHSPVIRPRSSVLHNSLLVPVLCSGDDNPVAPLQIRYSYAMG